MSHQPMGAAKPGAPELIASGLGWPEGPTMRAQVMVISPSLGRRITVCTLPLP